MRERERKSEHFSTTRLLHSCGGWFLHWLRFLLRSWGGRQLEKTVETLLPRLLRCFFQFRDSVAHIYFRKALIFN